MAEPRDDRGHLPARHVAGFHNKAGSMGHTTNINVREKLSTVPPRYELALLCADHAQIVRGTVTCAMLPNVSDLVQPGLQRAITVELVADDTTRT